MKDKVNGETLEFIEKQGQEMLALLWCELNAWGWPDILPGRPDDDNFRTVVGLLCDYIARIVPDKYLMRCWNVVVGGVTGDAFDEWYDSRPASHDVLDEILERHNSRVTMIHLPRPWTNHVGIMSKSAGEVKDE